jgi:hypothetical protein
VLRRGDQQHASADLAVKAKSLRCRRARGAERAVAVRPPPCAQSHRREYSSVLACACGCFALMLGANTPPLDGAGLAREGYRCQRERGRAAPARVFGDAATADTAASRCSTVQPRTARIGGAPSADVTVSTRASLLRPKTIGTRSSDGVAVDAVGLLCSSVSSPACTTQFPKDVGIRHDTASGPDVETLTHRPPAPRGQWQTVVRR